MTLWQFLAWFGEFFEKYWWEYLLGCLAIGILVGWANEHQRKEDQDDLARKIAKEMKRVDQ